MTANPLGRRAATARSGLAPADVVVGLVVVLVVFLFLLMAAPRARETARLTMCQNNLGQIGKALAYYDGAFGGLPFVGVPVAVDVSMDSAPSGPFRVMLETLGVSSFLGMDPEGRALPGLQAPTPEGIPVAGFLCASDPATGASTFPSPVSYRANVGADVHGSDGPFAISRPMSMAEVERRDGLGFTAAFSERLIGDGRNVKALENYRASQSLKSLNREGDGEQDNGVAAEPNGDASWRGDAGSTWRPADFRYTLYNHSIPPGWDDSQVGVDGRAAVMGASSGHARGVNLLMLDGSARLVSPSVAGEIWKSYATVGSESHAESTPSPPEE